MGANFGYRLVGSNSKNPENNCVESRNLLLTEEPKIMLTSQCTVQPAGGEVRNEEENEDVSGANIRIPFTLKNANTILTICTDQFSNFNIVFYWKVEVKQAKKRAKRARGTFIVLYGQNILFLCVIFQKIVWGGVCWSVCGVCWGCVGVC